MIFIQHQVKFIIYTTDVANNKIPNQSYMFVFIFHEVSSIYLPAVIKVLTTRRFSIISSLEGKKKSPPGVRQLTDCVTFNISFKEQLVVMLLITPMGENRQCVKCARLKFWIQYFLSNYSYHDCYLLNCSNGHLKQLQFQKEIVSS